MKRILKFRSGYSSQVLLYDFANLEGIITLDYGEDAYSRGYAVTRGALAFFTLAEDGLADISVWEGRPDNGGDGDKTAKGVLILESGELCIQEPEEPPLVLSVMPGEYNVVLNQKVTDAEGFLEIDVFLDRNASCTKTLPPPKNDW